MKVKRNLLLCSWLSFFLLISVLPGNASVFAQQEKLALSSTQLTVREIFDAISSQLRYDVFYNGEQLDLNRKVKFAQQVLNLEQVLDAVANNRFKYTLEDRTIILTPLTTPQTVNSVTLTGQVTDQSNTPLPGVTVLVKGTKLGTSTDPEGNFKLSLPQQENTILIFSFIGMESQEVPVGDPKKPIKVILKETAENLKEVVVTGIFTRKKESFTGSASTYTASELKTAGTQNILQSLKTLDPSFAILDNTLYGSDPNRLPNMEIRGKSSMLGMRDELEAEPTVVHPRRLRILLICNQRYGYQPHRFDHHPQRRRLDSDLRIESSQRGSRCRNRQTTSRKTDGQLQWKCQYFDARSQ